MLLIDLMRKWPVYLLYQWLTNVFCKGYCVGTSDLYSVPHSLCMVSCFPRATPDLGRGRRRMEELTLVSVYRVVMTFLFTQCMESSSLSHTYTDIYIHACTWCMPEWTATGWQDNITSHLRDQYSCSPGSKNAAVSRAAKIMSTRAERLSMACTTHQCLHSVCSFSIYHSSCDSAGNSLSQI